MRRLVLRLGRGLAPGGMCPAAAPPGRVSARRSEQLPGPPDVPFLLPRVADRDPDRVLPVELGVRQEDLAAVVDAGHQRFVVRVQLGVRQPGGAVAEADGRERDRREPLPVRLGLDPRGELAAPAAVLADPRRHPLGAEAADQDPELERAEAAAELDPVLVEVVDLALVAACEVLRHEAERVAERLGLPEQQQRGVERREHPLVRVDHDRVGALPAGEQAAVLGGERHRAAVGGVDVQPEPLALADLRDRVGGIDARRRRRAQRRDDAERPPAGPRSSRSPAPSRSARIRYASSAGIRRTPRRPIPATIAAFSIEECASVEA